MNRNNKEFVKIKINKNINERALKMMLMAKINCLRKLKELINEIFVPPFCIPISHWDTLPLIFYDNTF